MNVLNRHVAIGEAHSKLILVGEHIVVYNKPAIVIPFPLKIRTQIIDSPGEVTISSDFYTGNLLGFPGKGILECIQSTFKRCNKPMEGIQIQITSDIPVGRGLGSSAALATAIVRGIYAYFHKVLTIDELYSLVEIAETFAHGKPSGIDMMSVASDKPIFYQRPMGGSPLLLKKPIHMVVADTGKVGDTKRAVEHVYNSILQKPDVIGNIIEQIEDIVLKSKEAITFGDSEKLGNLLSQNHEKLMELGVSDPMLDHLVIAARNSGALGAKLTGGGMGGCIIALAKNDRDERIIANELMNQGAKMVWCFTTDSKEFCI
jgi:mevalonate kinase